MELITSWSKRDREVLLGLGNAAFSGGLELKQNKTKIALSEKNKVYHKSS